MFAALDPKMELHPCFGDKLVGVSVLKGLWPAEPRRRVPSQLHPVFFTKLLGISLE